MFYIIYGDAVFDSLTSIDQLTSIIFSFFIWILTGMYIINRVSIAMIEHGYVSLKYKSNNDWLTGKI